MKQLNARNEAGYCVVPFRISHLSYLVPIENEFEYSLTKESLIRLGLLYPILVVRTTRDEWLKTKELDPSILDPPQDGDVIYRIQCGNNRAKAAEELGYTHIDTVVFHRLQDAYDACRELRKDRSWR